MSFRVAFPFGNTPGRDHTMWPTITREVLRPILAEQLEYTDENDQNRFMDRLWPCPVTLEVLMHMAWKVREWRIDESSFTYSGHTSASPTPTWTIGATLPELSVIPKRVKVPADPDPLRDVRDELDLLGPASDRNLHFVGGTDIWKTLRNVGVRGLADPDDVIVTSSGGDVPSIEGTPVLRVGDYSMTILGQYVLYDPETQMFYPPFVGPGNFSALYHEPPGFPGTSGAQVEIYLLPVTPTATPDPLPSFGVAGDVQQGTLTIINPIIGEDVIEIPIGMFSRPAGSAPPAWPNGGQGSIDLTMTPIKWWPYATKTGLPVYDEDTGETLNPPFS